ncbi:MAG TPA: ABC transporter ATP-binding protein [Mycobacteriales bacterium]
MTLALEVRALRKAYGPLQAVDGLDLSAAAGAVTAVLGPNGAGKTTTVEICEGLRAADSGDVRVLGLPPGAAPLRARVGVMPQQAGAYPGARCGEMLRLMASYYRDPLNPSQLLDRLGLTAADRTPFRRLSGGQRQRLSLACAIVGRPAIVFLDEPTAGLDVQARQETHRLIRDLRDEGVAVVVTSHDMDETATLADHVVVVDSGRVVAAGTVADLTTGGDAIRFTSTPGLAVTSLPLPPGASAAEPEPGRYVVTGAVSPELVATVTAWVASQGALPQDIQVGRRSLEDVFLELTGRAVR